MPSRITRGTGLLAGIKARTLRLAGVKVTPVKIVTFVINAASVDAWVYLADAAYRVTKIECDYSVAGGSGAAATLRKVTADEVAPGAAAGATVIELQTAAFDLTATANTTQTATLSETPADLLLAAGDKVGVNMAGTLTNLAGGIIALHLEPV